MTDQPVPVSAFQPWKPVIKLFSVIQYFFVACCASTYILYAIARTTIGDHALVVSRNVDPKDLGSGLVTAVARVLHVPAAIGAIVGPWAGVPFAVVTLTAIVVGPGRRMGGRWLAVSVSALVLTGIVTVVGQLPYAEGIRQWILD